MTNMATLKKGGSKHPKHIPHDPRDHDTVGYRIRERRIEMGLTQLELDVRTGKRISSTATIEWRNSQRVFPDTAQRYAKALGLRWEWLLTGEGERLNRE